MRIGNAYPEPIDERRLGIWTSHRDLAQLVGVGLDHPDLLHLKRLADRPRDREDVAKLEEILRLKEERGEA